MYVFTTKIVMQNMQHEKKDSDEIQNNQKHNVSNKLPKK